MPNLHQNQKALSLFLALLVSSGYTATALAAETSTTAGSTVAATEGKSTTTTTTSAPQAIPTPAATAPAATAPAPTAPAPTAPTAQASATTPPATAAPTATTTPVAGTPATADSKDAAAATDTSAAPKMLWKPGQSLETATDTEDIVATYDVDLAKSQCAAYPDSPEATFILAVALTRTSRVEEALQQVRRAQKLADSKGGPGYFDKMITSYEQMLVNYPKDNKVRYGLAWAYYMKAYLLAQRSRNIAKYNANVAAVKAGKTTAAAAAPVVANKDVVKALSGGNANSMAQLATAAMALAGGGGTNMPKGSLPHIPSALENVEASDIPQIKRYYEMAIQKLSEILHSEPDDVWSTVYMAHLKAEYTGDLAPAMTTWKATEAKHPNNPAPYFFLGEGYLKQGNLKESINHVSRAIALRALGN